MNDLREREEGKRQRKGGREKEGSGGSERQRDKESNQAEAILFMT